MLVILQVASVIGAIFGGPIGGLVADSWGRKTSLAINITPYLLGYFIILTTYLIQHAATFMAVIVIGRFFTGVGMGWSFTIVPVCIYKI